VDEDDQPLGSARVRGRECSGLDRDAPSALAQLELEAKRRVVPDESIAGEPVQHREGEAAIRRVR
jgi:hypothetical protein